MNNKEFKIKYARVMIKRAQKALEFEEISSNEKSFLNGMIKGFKERIKLLNERGETK